jgi:hypothetical protein
VKAETNSCPFIITMTMRDTQTPIQTPEGMVYPLQPLATQLLVLFAALAGSIGLAAFFVWIFGVSAHLHRILVYLPCLLTFAFGFALWLSRLKLIALQGIGKGLWGAAVAMFVTRQRPTNLQELLPTRELLERMAVRAQKAASTFMHVAILLVLGWTPVALLSRLPIGLVLIVALCTMLYGHLLARLGRHGYLPFPEE